MLARVVIINLRKWALHTDKLCHIRGLGDAVACSRRALSELKEWYDEGNRTFIDTRQPEFPAELNFEFFETTRALSEMLYEFTCLSQAKTDEELCAHDFNCVLLAVLSKAESVQQNAHQSDNMPYSLLEFVDQTCAATILSVGEQIHASADRIRVLDPPRTIPWDHVRLLYEKALYVVGNAYFPEEKMDALGYSKEKIKEEFECIDRIARGALTDPNVPTKVVIGTEVPHIEYPFPF